MRTAIASSSTLHRGSLPALGRLVIDQSVTFDTMAKINNALGALQGAFTPYDEVAVFTYNNGPTDATDFTAAQSARLGAVLEHSKGKGRDPVDWAWAVRWPRQQHQRQ